jgi:predicted GIY-YIG superfamily endonuclease
MQYLYRAYDSSDNLLYVGISGQWSERLHAHERSSEWLQLTDRVNIERYPDRDSVVQAEKRAIIEEKPTYNKVHNQTYESVYGHWLKIKSWVKSGDAPDFFHQWVIDDIREEASYYGLSPSRIKPASAAFLFEWSITHLERLTAPVCRNCLGVAKSKLMTNAIRAGRDQLRAIGESQ